ncbi:hypothetical protein [Alistipes putredinis]|uniref:hypothetical protein n=1 Tax=Alistipes putredinis TaxID=28117 RepID=UPI003F7CA18A
MELWQSASLNDRLYHYYIDVITKMAVSRFRWLNLPASCDERYLELTLVHQGMASIAFPRSMPGTFLTLQCAPLGKPDMYDRTVRWYAIGTNGTKYRCDRQQGVVAYDNETRYPLMDGIELYANELAHIRITRRVNRLHQQIPFILTGPQERRQDMVNLFKQVAGGEPAVIGTSDLQQIEYQALQTGVTFLGEELAVDEQNVWGRVYTMLGIKNTTMKQERQTEDEIRAQENPASLIAASALTERRKVADELNSRFGKYLDAPIEVVWRQDNESDNWNLAHNMQSISKAASQ